jgi:predicted secreted protein
MAAPKTKKTIRTDEIDERIVDGLSAGTPLRVLCREDGMPSWRTVYHWIEADAEFATRIARARERGFDAIAEETLDLADGVAHQSEAIQKAKLQIDTRLKLLAKWSPTRYGDKQTHSIGGDPDAPAVQVEHGVDAETMAALSKALLERPQGK